MNQSKIRNAALALTMTAVMVVSISSQAAAEEKPALGIITSSDRMMQLMGTVPQPSPAQRLEGEERLLKLPSETDLRAGLRAAGSKAADEPTDINDLAYYAKREGVSKTQAVKQMLLEKRADVLLNWLTVNRSESYTELRIERNPFRVVYLSTADPKTALEGAPLGDLAGITSATQVAYSKQTLDRAAETAIQDLTKAGLQHDLVVDNVNQRILVGVTAGLLERATQVLTTASAARGAGSPPLTVAVGGSQPTAYRSYGGLKFLGAKRCTVAFTALRSDNIRVMWTAGHCVDSGDVISDGSYSPFRLDYEHYSGGQDIQQMYTTRGDVDQAPWIRDGLNPSGDATPYFRDLLYTDYQRSTTGSTVYRYGDTSGYDSGYIRTTQYKPGYVPNSTATFYTAGVTSRCGDSGGPVFNGNTAKGVISGVTVTKCEDATAGDSMIYMPLANETMNSRPLSRNEVGGPI